MSDTPTDGTEPTTDATEEAAAPATPAEAAVTDAPAEVAAAPEADAAPPPPTDELREGLVERLRAELGDALLETHIAPGDDLWIRVTRASWREAGAVARNELGCTYFDFLSAIDWLPSPFGRDMDSQEDISVQGTAAKDPGTIEWGVAGGTSRFQILARVEAPKLGHGVTLKADLDDDEPSIESWIPIYAGADWHERETHEMYGIDFVGHPNLRHIYLPGDFEGHPLRKDFPLLARRVKPWPGIVDVEPMPGEDAAEETAEEPTDA